MVERLRNCKCVLLAGKKWIFTRTKGKERWTLRSNTSISFSLKDRPFYSLEAPTTMTSPELAAQAALSENLELREQPSKRSVGE